VEDETPKPATDSFEARTRRFSLAALTGLNAGALQSVKEQAEITNPSKVTFIEEPETDWTALQIIGPGRPTSKEVRQARRSRPRIAQRPLGRACLESPPLAMRRCLRNRNTRSRGNPEGLRLALFERRNLKHLSEKEIWPWK
jgi:hypothetical protein